MRGLALELEAAELNTLALINRHRYSCRVFRGCLAKAMASHDAGIHRSSNDALHAMGRKAWERHHGVTELELLDDTKRLLEITA